MHNELFGSGLAAKLRSSAGWTYTALCNHANRKQSATFNVADSTLASDTGLAPRTIIEARKKLLAFGLIECAIFPGRSAVYTMKSFPLEWIPVKDRPRSKCKPRGNTSAKFAEVETEEPCDLPHILRGTGANYARPFRFSK
jgi:hypothetical protein